MDKYPVNFLERETEYIKPRYTRVIFFIVAILLVIGIGGCIHKARNSSSNIPIEYDPVTLEPLAPKGIFNKIKHFIFTKNISLEGERQDRINFLITGQGGPGHDGPFLTDTIILASIKPSTGQIGFVSIPRDLAVTIPGHGEKKINHANAFGEVEEKNSGPLLTKKIVEDILKEEIHYYIRVDFQAFVDVIDAVNGISVNVERSFVDQEYPAENYEYQTISFKKGTQVMDGETALMFVRSRHGNNGEGSDFARSQRQQKVLLALKDKILSFSTVTSPNTMKDIADSLNKNIVTNMTFSDMIAFLKTGKDLNTDNIINLTLDNGPNGYLENATGADGSFILLPTDRTFEQIQSRVEQLFDDPPATVLDTTPPQTAIVTTSVAAIVKTPQIEIQNATWRVGLAARVKSQLDEQYPGAIVSNTKERPLPKSGLYVLTNTIDPAMVKAIATKLQIPFEDTALPPGESASSTSDLLIILGDDFIE